MKFLEGREEQQMGGLETAGVCLRIQLAKEKEQNMFVARCSA